jgi:uncharacterized membrane-anchored protein
MDTVATLTTHEHAPAAARPTVDPRGRQMLNKVPEITFYFWIIKVLCTTVGETAADFLNTTLNLGLSNTTYIMSGALIIVMVFQFRLRRYVPGVYWLGVVLISVVGTLITDNLTDNVGISLVTSTIVFSIALAATFASWYASEKSLSIHTIVTTRREAFYWVTVLFTFALGTAAGDLSAEKLGVGYWRSALIFGGAIALTYLLNSKFKLNAILAFWIAYILTRPLGASIGDYLSQAQSSGGLGLGTTTTSAIFLVAILAVVIFLTTTRRDRIDFVPSTPGRNPAPAPTTLPALSRVLVVANKVAVSSSLVDAVRTRATASPSEFVMLIPNPGHLPFDRVSRDLHEGESILAEALPVLSKAAGGEIEGVVAASPNAYDDIVEALSARDYTEVILETPPTHVSHWLHLELSRRIADLGYPVTTVPSSDSL